MFNYPDQKQLHPAYLASEGNEFAQETDKLSLH